ncbi:tight adherence protein B [Melghirimyces thermohalophilus]|uniref:Tight adherence protein B n=1 Tax=Melghirimyces thermohalophilus TaxID=1236220 RepID=A0A1G6RVV1_9BACL|nr:type II secretion system F family protein [Melghirimyces thermohalophilus]SDD08790.1 tight adherence protein B [Melghirimyces thermohalophilus]
MNSGLVIALLGGAAIFCLMVALYYRLKINREKQQIHEAVGKWIQAEGPTQGWSDDLADRLDQTQWAKNLAPKLKRASVKLRPSEYGAVLFLLGVMMIFLFHYGMDAPVWISLIISTSLTPLLSKLFLNSRKHIYIHRMDAQLSEACRLLSSAARAGLSIPQGLELVVKELPSPIKDELGVVVNELRLGRDLELSLNELLTRVSSRDLQVFINALIIQRRAGGDLAKVLGEMATTMEERKIIHKTVEASIAQARYSAYLLPAVSLLIVYMMSQMVDNFFQMFTDPKGMILLAIFIFLQVIGFIFIKKIADIRI